MNIWTVPCFELWTFMHSICKICISSFLVRKPRRIGKCMSKFTGNKLALYWSDYHSTLPPAVYGTPAAPRLTTLGFAPIWSFHHSARVVTHHYGVTLLANDTEHLSLCLLGVHRWSFFHKAPSQLELFDFWLGDKFFFMYTGCKSIDKSMFYIYTFFLPVCGLSFQMPFEEVLNFALIAFSFLICTFWVFKKKISVLW